VPTKASESTGMGETRGPQGSDVFRTLVWGWPEEENKDWRDKEGIKTFCISPFEKHRKTKTTKTVAKIGEGGQ